MQNRPEKIIKRCDSPSQRRRILEEPNNGVYVAQDLMKCIARLGITATERENVEEPVAGVLITISSATDTSRYFP